MANLALWTLILAAWKGFARAEPEPLKFTLTLLILTGLCWLAACHFRPRLRGPGWMWFCLAIATATRVMAWQVPPAFSDDLLRYRWEGRVQAAGENPYLVRPVDRPELLRAQDDRMPGREVRAVYGPLVLWTERVAYWVSRENLLALRWPYALADLALLALLFWRYGVGAVVYAWCPLAVFEFWSAGHNDALCLLALTTSLWAFETRRFRVAWVSLGCAVLTKWWPLMLIPLLAGRERAAWRSLPWIALPALPLFAHYGIPPLLNAQFASGFVGGWRNNDSLFGGLLWLNSGDLYAAKYLAFALLGIWLVWLASRKWPAAQKSLAAVAGLLAVSANVHPWYVLWLLPFVMEATPPFALVWLWLAPITHEATLRFVATGVWDGVQPSRWLVYGPVALALLIRALNRNHDGVALLRGGK